jgi:C-terminal processing protease CtpA/Prc
MKKFKNIPKLLLLSLFLIGLFQNCSLASTPGTVAAIASASTDRRNIIGIEMITATDEQKAAAGCKEGGIYVSAVIPQHPADIAGLKVGDIITEVITETGPVPIKEMSDAFMALDGLEAGRRYPFKVCRQTPAGPATLKIDILVEQVQERSIGKIN